MRNKKKVFSQLLIEAGVDASCNEKYEPLPMQKCMVNMNLKSVSFEHNATRATSFSFERWYGSGIDSITYALQEQIQRFLDKKDGVLNHSTISSHCKSGVMHFLNYIQLTVGAGTQKFDVTDINRNLIDGYLNYLNNLNVVDITKQGHYFSTKTVLMQMGKRGVFKLILDGHNATFPKRSPFSSKYVHGQKPLSNREREDFSKALKNEVLPIYTQENDLNADLLSYAFVSIALYTGRNATPLFEMESDCLRPHPKDGKSFLIVNKRRGYTTSKVIIKSERGSLKIPSNDESTKTIQIGLAKLIQTVIEHCNGLREEAPPHLKKSIWLYRKYWGGTVTALAPNTIDRAIAKLIIKHNLRDADGNLLKVNISRLRKTFANRIYELLGGDLVTSAIALGNTPQVAGRNYLRPSEDVKRNWRFMGEILVEELTKGTIGDTYKLTPMGHCSDQINGQYSTKQSGAACFSFLNCVRCKQYVVTGDDLYKLFSFYYRIYSEKPRVDKKTWAKQYAHIPRLIDEYIVPEGIRRKIFDKERVESARQQARAKPHPFWSFDNIHSLEIFI